MSESLERDDQGSTVVDEIREAHKLANTVTLNRLTSAIDRNPAADLAQVLQQQANGYSQLRDSLAKSAQQRPLGRDRDRFGGPDKAAGETRRPISKLQGSFVEGSIKILYPLHETVVQLVSLRESEPDFESGSASQSQLQLLAAGVNDALTEGEIL